MGDVYSIKQPINAHFSTHFQMTDEQIWHARLGHPSMRLVQHLHKKGAIKVSNKQFLDFICESCNLAKATQLPFLPVNKRSHLPFELVHFDLWGPAPVVSKQGFRFYVCIVDDFTHFTRLIPMKAKSEFYDQFILFENFVQ